MKYRIILTIVLKRVEMLGPFSLRKGEISIETAKIAEDELRETPENMDRGMQELRDFLKKDSSIYFKTDDKILTIFLRPCKWHARSAYELMKRVADFREKYNDLLGGLLPREEYTAFTDENIVCILKDRDQKGRRVLVVNCGAMWDPSTVSSDQIFRLFYLIHEAAVLEPETQVRGVVVVMDFNGMGMKHVLALSPSFSMKLLGFIQDAMPLRLKEIHMINQPFVFKMVWSTFKPFIKEKFRTRIFFHGSKMSSLHEYLSPTHLPEDYGGKLPKIDYGGIDWWPCIEENYKHFETWNTFGLVKK